MLNQMEVMEGFSSKSISHKEKELIMIWSVKLQICRCVHKEQTFLCLQTSLGNLDFSPNANNLDTFFEYSFL